MDEDYVAGRICSFWMSVTKISSQAGLDRRQVARIEADLLERGLLAKSASDHSPRGGSRRDGKIGHEFGINLAPLIARAAEIQAAARKAAFEDEEAERLRNRIKKLFGDIRRLGFDGAMEAAEEVLPNRRPSTIQSFERLTQVAEALEAVRKDFSAEFSRGEKSHQCDISPPPNTDKENINKTCRAKKGPELRPVSTTPGQVALLASEPLREIIELYWEAVDKRGPLSWRTILFAARDAGRAARSTNARRDGKRTRHFALRRRRRRDFQARGRKPCSLPEPSMARDCVEVRHNIRRAMPC